MTDNTIDLFLTCPITKEIFWQPVVAQDGYIYEKTAIEKWFKSKKSSPCTNLIIGQTLIPVPTYKQLVDFCIEKDPSLKTKMFKGYNTHENNKNKVDDIMIKGNFNKLVDYKDFVWDLDISGADEATTFMELLFINCADENILIHVIEHSLIPFFDTNWLQPTHIACKYSSLEIVKNLLNTGFDVKDLDEDNSNLLHYASENRKNGYTILKFLIDSDVDINTKNDLGFSPFHMICQNQNMESIKYCVDHGADLELADNDGWYPIHYICEFANLETIKYFLTLDINLNVVPSCNNNSDVDKEYEKTPEKMIYRNCNLSDHQKKEAMFEYLKKYFEKN